MRNVALMSEPKKDRHKPSKLVRVKAKLADLLGKVADRNATSVPEEANRAVREMLEREGYWPPKESGKK